MIRRPPRSTQSRSSAASDVYKRQHRSRLLLVLALLSASCSGVKQIKMKLPLKPRLPLKGNERVAVAPFLIVTQAEKPKDRSDLAKIDLQQEFHRFLVQKLERKTKLQVVD